MSTLKFTSQALPPAFGTGVIGSATHNLLVKRDGVPAADKVLLVDEFTGRIVRELNSSADGSWQIDNLDPNRKYSAIVDDSQLALNGAIATRLVPVTL